MTKVKTQLFPRLLKRLRGQRHLLPNHRTGVQSQNPPDGRREPAPKSHPPIFTYTQAFIYNKCQNTFKKSFPSVSHLKYFVTVSGEKLAIVSGLITTPRYPLYEPQTHISHFKKNWVSPPPRTKSNCAQKEHFRGLRCCRPPVPSPSFHTIPQCWTTCSVFRSFCPPVEGLLNQAKRCQDWVWIEGTKGLQGRIDWVQIWAVPFTGP